MLKAFSSIGAFIIAGFLWHTNLNDPIPGDKESFSPGRMVKDTNFNRALVNYTNYCGGCHGEKMDAFVDRKWKHGSNREELFHAIKHGYENEGMPGFDTTFTDEETYELSDYILTGIENLKKYDFGKDVVKVNFFPSKDIDIRLDTIVKGIGVAWGMTFLPNGDMLFTEKSGKLYRVDKSKKKQQIGGVPEVLYAQQAGLMDIELHPQFRKNNVLYLSYSAVKKSDGKPLSTTAIMRAVLKGNELTEQKIIFEALPYLTPTIHYGCRLEFDRNGFLYFTVGDRSNYKEHPQSLSNPFGKIHRIKQDGTIPADNPFVNTPGAVTSIYTFGNRNPQGLAMQPSTGIMWEDEHGPRGGDEVNIIKKGKNYGWPVISYGIDYNGVPITNITRMEGMEQPELYWIPSIGPGGMTFVKGNRYPAWTGDLMATSMRFGYLNRCKIKGTKIISEEMLVKNMGRMRDVQQAPDGYLYISVEKGYIFRLVPVKK
ncbi:MAG: PQQ-dependent sugar dehydrogenase [Ferruginibacter sp.]|nr:PQQ-dependent sugar dehydrogenase [Chitinophagaceae bacterium]